MQFLTACCSDVAVYTIYRHENKYAGRSVLMSIYTFKKVSLAPIYIYIIRNKQTSKIQEIKL